MIRKTTFKKKIKYVISRGAKKVGLVNALNSISREKYAEKISASILYGILSSIAVNFFFPTRTCLFQWSDRFSPGNFGH
ncbi:hypothetical protein BOVMAS02_13530 [Streptococcus uberis]